MVARVGPQRLPCWDPLPCPLCPAALLCASAFSSPFLPLLETECELSYRESLLHRQLIWIERG